MANSIVRKYFGKAPETVKTVAGAIKDPELTETDKKISVTVNVPPDVLDGVTEEMLHKAAMASEAFKATTAAAVANIHGKHPDKKVNVTMKVGDVMEVRGSVLKSGKIVTHVSNHVENDEYKEYLAKLDEEMQKTLEAK